MRVLHIVGSMHAGGIENFIMNLYRNIDRSKVQFDFVTHTGSDPAYVAEIEKLGGRIYELPRLTRRPASNLKQIRDLVRKNGYVAVIRHTPNALVAPQLLAARRGGSVAICHSHSTTDPKFVLHMFGKFVLNYSHVERFACSTQAGIWMFGNKSFEIVHNAIDVDRFAYNQDRRFQIRSELGISENVPVYGHIANFIEVKNHKFLIQIYKAISDNFPDAVFICVGEGILRQSIMEQAKELGLEKRIYFTGMRSDVEAFMSAMDVMIFPSIFEGLPLTLIEAQAAGLPMLVSDAVTKEAEVTERLISWKSIDVEPAEWAQKAIELFGEHKPRTCQRESIKAAGYDIHELARWYEEYFESLK